MGKVKEIKRVSLTRAIEKFNLKMCEVYLLYDDGTEAVAGSIQEIINHHSYGLKFGIEA